MKKIASSALVTLDINEGVASLTLNRPPLNILTLEMMRELAAALDTLVEKKGTRKGHPYISPSGAGVQHVRAPLADAPVKALVLTAAGKAFCAGVDVADHLPEKVEPMIREFGELFTRLRALPVPTIAVVQGAALGGGTELALACDQVLAAASARFGQPEIRLGVFPPIAAALFPQLVGYQQAARLVLSGEAIPASEAARLGLITFVAADEELPAALEHLLARFRGTSAVALRMAKRALLAGARRGLDALPEIEDLYLHDLMATADAHEGIQAFIEKRQPVWRDT